MSEAGGDESARATFIISRQGLDTGWTQDRSTYLYMVIYSGEAS